MTGQLRRRAGLGARRCEVALNAAANLFQVGREAGVVEGEARVLIGRYGGMGLHLPGDGLQLAQYQTQLGTLMSRWLSHRQGDGEACHEGDTSKRLGVGHGVDPLEDGSTSVPKDEAHDSQKTGFGPFRFLRLKALGRLWAGNHRSNGGLPTRRGREILI